MHGIKTNASKILIGTTCAEICKRCVCASKSSTSPPGMGKKSKRRGGGGSGGKRNAGVSNSRNHAGGDRQAGSGRFLATADTGTLLSAEEAAALLRVPTPNSFKGIISTNDQPDKCFVCFSDLFILTFKGCCGKVFCPDCYSRDRPRKILDLRGKHRCEFCNNLVSKRDAILKQEAQLGKPWAQYVLGLSLFQANETTNSFHWFRKAARAGHPHAFHELSKIFLGGIGIKSNFVLSKHFVDKARSLYSGMGLRCNTVLMEIAIAHISDGKEDEAQAILVSMSRETDESALDAKLCASVAAHINDVNSSAEMYARSFCYGRIESANSASLYFFRASKYGLSKLWLDVACKKKSFFTSEQLARTGETMAWTDYQSDRDEVRSKLREMRNSCGGCGTALAGDRRKYCRRCRTHCYCNEDCQKRHWDNGHREECQEVEEHMHKILRAIRLGRFDSLCQTAST